MWSGGRFLKSGGGTRFPLDVPEALIRFDDGDVNLAQRQLARHLRRRGRGRMVIREQLVMSWGVLVQARGEENTTSDHTILKSGTQLSTARHLSPVVDDRSVLLRHPLPEAIGSIRVEVRMAQNPDVLRGI